MDNYKGKAIYNPSGKAGEYSHWACNFYVGCSNGCAYCYLKKGRGRKILGGDKPVLKKCFKDEKHALQIFERELHENVFKLRKQGLFFSFTTDPMLPETTELTSIATQVAFTNRVPVKILTKNTSWVSDVLESWWLKGYKDMIAFGFTLTGHDELEPNASTNGERIRAMKMLKEAGFKTFASVEPIITFSDSLQVIEQIKDYCDLIKVGLESGRKYNVINAQTFVERLDELQKPKIYLKESLQKISRYTNTELDDYFVERDYNQFNQS